MQLHQALSTALVRFAFAIAVLLTLMNQNVQALNKPIRTVKNNGTEYEGLAYNVNHDSQTYIVAKFLGISFADPPERFAKPTLQNPEPGTQHVKTFKAICQQKIDPLDGCQKGQDMSEDCLFLNIYVPLPSYTLQDLSTLPPTTPTSPSTETTLTTTPTPSSTTKTTPTTTSDPTTNSPSNSPASTTKTPSTPGATTHTLSTTTILKASAAEEQVDEDSADEAEVNVLTLPSANESYAVLIYIHGGAYMEGAANCYDGSRLAGLGNIIVVTINYRLGPFGFLSTNDDVIPGNLGLWDQHVAIQWVSQNIHRFGGDPGRITVGGQSAGSYSSIFQGLYEDNDQLFHRIIAQSGTPTAFKSVSTSGYATTLDVANRLNCSIEGEGKSKEIKECLMKKEAEDLAEARPHVIVPGTMAIQPTLDAPFALKDPHDILSVTPNFADTKKPEVPKHFTNKDLLMGVDAQDGEVVYTLFLYDNAKANLTTINQETMAVLLKLYFQSDYKDEVDDVLIEAILDRYIDWEDSDNVTILSNRAVEILTDIFFAIPALDTATSHSIPSTAADVTRQRRSARVAALRSTYRQTRDASNANNDTVKQEGTNDQVKRASTYFYRFSLPTTSRFFPWFEGTPHASEIRYVFGRESLLNDGQRNISKQIMTYWTNFVKTGNPNKAMVDDEATSSTSSPLPLSVPEWEEYTNTDQKYLEIALSPGPETKSELLAGARHFWSEYMPRLKRRLAEKVDRTRNDGQDCPKQRNVGDSGSRLSSGYFALCLALLALIFL